MEDDVILKYFFSVAISGPEGHSILRSPGQFMFQLYAIFFPRIFNLDLNSFSDSNYLSVYQSLLLCITALF